MNDASSQLSLYPPELPPGFVFQPDFVSGEEGQRLLEELARIEFETFEMRGQTARRRVRHYGFDYAYDSARLTHGEPVPAFLSPLRQKLGAWAGVAPETYAEVLLTEYSPGAGIGWHRDAPGFDRVAGISLGADCDFRLRPRSSPRDVLKLRLPSRSAYRIEGAARWAWEHHIPSVPGLRYSITFRTLRRKGGEAEESDAPG